MMAQRSMFCTCKKSKIGEVLPLLLCYTVPCTEDQLKAKAPWHENVIQAKVFVAYHNKEVYEHSNFKRRNQDRLRQNRPWAGSHSGSGGPLFTVLLVRTRACQTPCTTLYGIQL